MNPLALIVIIAIGIIAYLVTSDVLKNFSGFRYPGVLAALVTLIGCVGLLGASESAMAVITIPFAALIIAGAFVAGIAVLVNRKDKFRPPHKVDEVEKTQTIESKSTTTHSPWKS